MKDELTTFIQEWQCYLIKKSDEIFHWIEEKRPKKIIKTELNHSSKRIQVLSRGYISTTNEYCLRTVHFHSKNFQIVTLLILPIGNPTLFPAYILELVLAGQLIHIGIIDIENIVEPKTPFELQKDLIESLKNYLSISNYIEHTSDWFKQIVSNEAIVYQGKIEKLTDLKSASIDYLSHFLKYCRTKISKNKHLLLDHKSVHTYKELHLKHSPAFRITSNEQDKLWMHTFLKDYHFKIYL
jgi:hypothetical protein